MLIDPGLRHANSQRPNARNHADTLRHADGAAGVKEVKQVRALQAEVESAERRESVAFVAAWLAARRLSRSLPVYVSLLATATLLQQRLALRLVHSRCSHALSTSAHSKL